MSSVWVYNLDETTKALVKGPGGARGLSAGLFV